MPKASGRSWRSVRPTSAGDDMSRAARPERSSQQHERCGARRVLVVDDHEVVRAGLLAAIAGHWRFVAMGDAPTGRTALQVAPRLQPDIAIVDMRLPDMGGDELCRALRTLIPDLAVVVLSSYFNEDVVSRALDAGASAYVTKSQGLSDLFSVLDSVAAERDHSRSWKGEAQIRRCLADLARSREENRRLTDQQSRVITLLAEGLTYRAVAARLQISESTVRFHVQKLKTVFNTGSRTELVVRAVRSRYSVGQDDETVVTQRCLRCDEQLQH